MTLKDIKDALLYRLRQTAHGKAPKLDDRVACAMWDLIEAIETDEK